MLIWVPWGPLRRKAEGKTENWKCVKTAILKFGPALVKKHICKGCAARYISSGKLIFSRFPFKFLKREIKICKKLLQTQQVCFNGNFLSETTQIYHDCYRFTMKYGRLRMSKMIFKIGWTGFLSQLMLKKFAFLLRAPVQTYFDFWRAAHSQTSHGRARLSA